MQFSKSIAENEALLRQVFDNDDVFILRRLRTGDGGECFIAYFDGMVNIQVLDLNVVQPVQNEPQLQDLQYKQLLLLQLLALDLHFHL